MTVIKVGDRVQHRSRLPYEMGTVEQLLHETSIVPYAAVRWDDASDRLMEHPVEVLLTVEQIEARLNDTWERLS